MSIQQKYKSRDNGWLLYLERFGEMPMLKISKNMGNYKAKQV